jgi:hypothetical protein
MDKMLYQNDFVPLVYGCPVMVFPTLLQRSYHMSAILHVCYLMQSPDITYKLNQGIKHKKTGNFLYSEAKIRNKTKSERERERERACARACARTCV